jgi:hypothetical protein
MKRTLLVVAAMALIGAVFASPAASQFLSSPFFMNRPMDKKAVLEFSGPVSLPDVTLPAGRYMFRLPSPWYAPSVVQVLSEDGKSPYAMVETVPIIRIETEENHGDLVTFRETAADRAPQIAAWFPDTEVTDIGRENVGCEFIYER